MYPLTKCTLFIFCWAACFASFSPLIPSQNDNNSAESYSLEPINGTNDFRINLFKGQDRSIFHDDRNDRYTTKCVRPAKCENLMNTSCFGTKIPFRYTSTYLTKVWMNNGNMMDTIRTFEALRYVPKCWAFVQPFLCAVHMPKCEKINDREMVHLPSFDMCRVIMEPCRLLYNDSFFQEYLKCNHTYFPCRNCGNHYSEMKFNATGQCMPPLVSTESSDNHYKDIEGCGIQCRDPLYTSEEHEAVHMLIFWGALLCIICNAWLIATFFIHDWKHLKQPSWNLFYISICMLFNWMGWFVQFLPGYRNKIVCRGDGTLRHSEPSAGENLSCIIPFIVIYYFLLAANVWFAIFTYAWYLQTFDRVGARDRINKSIFYFHFTAWALPFVLTVTVMVLSEVDGNSIIGICFVGYRNRVYRKFLVLLPVVFLTIASFVFTFMGCLNLQRIKRSNRVGELKKLNFFIIRMGIRTMLVVLFISAFCLFEIQEFKHADEWAKSLHDLIICKIKSSYRNETPQNQCKLTIRPSVVMLQLRLICLFCVNLVISSWSFNWFAFKSWDRFIRSKMGCNSSDDQKMKPKHQIVADTYAKRMDDKISVSLEKPHTDPTGLNFDVNNMDPTQSGSMTQSFVNYLYNVPKRRNGDAGLVENCSQQFSSCDSEFSCSVRHFNLSVESKVESRRGSLDSHFSIQMSGTETEIKAKVNGTKHVKMKARNRQHSVIAQRSHRRESNSSIESQRISNHRHNSRYKRHSIRKPNERRNAFANIDPRDVYDLMKKIRINPISLTTSDEDQSKNGSQHINSIQDIEPTNMLMPHDCHMAQSQSDDDDEDVHALQILRTSNGAVSQNEKLQMLTKSLRQSDGHTKDKENRFDDTDEAQQQLITTKRIDALSIVARKNAGSMSMSEEREILKRLLLPSK